MRWRRLCLLGLVVTLAVVWPGGAGAQKTAGAFGIEITGLDDDQEVRGMVNFSATVDAGSHKLSAYVQTLPWFTGTSVSVGNWLVQDGVANDLQLDTRYVPDGMQAITFYSRDRHGRVTAIRSFSIWVRNRARTPAGEASLFELARPLNGEAVPNQVQIKTQERGRSGRVVQYEYRVTPLRGLFSGRDTVLPGPVWDTRNVEPGSYAITAWALDGSGQRLDRSTVTVQVPERSQR